MGSIAMWNLSVWNDELWNDAGGVPFIPGEIVDTPDPGVSFTISDELGGFEEAISDECMC
jgi:hypothetical protein